MTWFTIHEVAGVGENEPVPGDRILGRFDAADALAALDAYSEAEGFAPYSATEMLNEVTFWNDARTVASAPFTNTEVMAIPATSGERTDGELAMSFLDAAEADDNVKVAETEMEIIERLGIGPDDTEQGLTRDAVLRVEEFVSNALGRAWTYEDSGMLGVVSARESESKRPTVYIVIGSSAYAYDERGGILETPYEDDDHRPDWTGGGVCDERGAGPEAFSALVRALDAAEESARWIGADIERVREEKGDAVCYTLENYSTDRALASAEVDANGEVMVLRAISAEDASDGVAQTAYDNAVEMAKFILEDQESRDGLLPVLGILGHDHDDPFQRYDVRDDDPQSWSCGWVQDRDGEITVHGGVTEDSAELWDWLFTLTNEPRPEEV